MDTNVQINRTGNKKGFVLVWFIILIPVVVLLALMAIDFGYMYMAKGQLQNAADSAALAGAAILTESNDIAHQGLARDAAVKFANANKTATQNVVINRDSDIVFGYWNSSNSTFTVNGSPINAIQVRAARDAASAGGQVPIVFGRYFGWDKMGASATATAAIPARATSNLLMCVDFCQTGSTFPSFATYTSIATPPKVMDTGPTQPFSDRYAWTSFDSNVSSASDIISLICVQTSVSKTACGQAIYATMGTDKSILCNLEAQMYNPAYDAGNKDFVAKGINTTGWWVIVPVIQTCPPGAQPYPNPVVRYAKIHILAVCTQGCGSGSIKAPCSPYSAPSGVCNTIKAKYNLASVQNIVIIDKISCAECPASQFLPGLRPVLVK